MAPPQGWGGGGGGGGHLPQMPHPGSAIESLCMAILNSSIHVTENAHSNLKIFQFQLHYYSTVVVQL